MSDANGISSNLRKMKSELDALAKKETAEIEQKLDTLRKEIANIVEKKLNENAENLRNFATDMKNIEKNTGSFFKTLRIEEIESVHSNFLAWLLDPSGDHELGSRFTEQFLRKAAQKAEKEIIDLARANGNSAE